MWILSINWMHTRSVSFLRAICDSVCTFTATCLQSRKLPTSSFLGTWPSHALRAEAMPYCEDRGIALPVLQHVLAFYFSHTCMQKCKGSSSPSCWLPGVGWCGWAWIVSTAVTQPVNNGGHEEAGTALTPSPRLMSDRTVLSQPSSHQHLSALVGSEGCIALLVLWGLRTRNEDCHSNHPRYIPAISTQQLNEMADPSEGAQTCKRTFVLIWILCSWCHAAGIWLEMKFTCRIWKAIYPG